MGQTPQPITSTSLFLVTGGARGITANCVIRMAEHYRCGFLLLGRSAFGGPEPDWARGCTDEAELKRRIMADISAQQEKPTPAKVQQRFNALLSQREINETLQAVAQVGGRAEYLSVDITDGAALRAALAPVVQRLGAVTGIIHGAGVLADKLIEQKTAQDFERVYATKVQGLANLLDVVPPAQLDTLVLFSSVAGFFGNVGQSDYALANEVLNKTAHLFKKSYPQCRVLAMNWGPWDGGMVTPALKKLFAERQINVIPIDAGTQILLDALDGSPTDAVQLLVGSGLKVTPGGGDAQLRSYQVRRRLTLAANPFLHDHAIGGQAVLPMVSALAWMADTCEQLSPGYTFFACEDYRVLKGIVFDETLAEEYILDLKELAKEPTVGVTFETVIWSQTPEGKRRYHYRATIRLVRQVPEAPIYQSADLREHQPIPGAQLYHDGTLFHGPAFQGIERVLNVSPQKLTMVCYLPQVDPAVQGQFQVQSFNHFLADTQFQSMVVWARQIYAAGSLPLRVLRGERFQDAPLGQPFYVSLDVVSSSETTLVSDITAHDAQGRVFTRVFGAEVTISKGLNRLFERAVERVVS